MKRQTRFIIVLSILMTPIIYMASCGYEAQTKPAETAKSGQNDNLNQAAVSTTVGAQNNNAQPETVALTTNQAPTIPSIIDVPEATPALGNPLDQSAIFGAGVPPDPISLSHLPYHCDPRNYAPNIIQNNAACRRFGNIPYLGYGLDHAPPIPPIAPEGPIGYRIKRHVGRVDRDDDDDDRRGRWKSYRRD